MNPMIEERIDHPSAWTSASIRGKEALAFDLGLRHLAAFERAIGRVRARGLALDDVGRGDFPLARKTHQGGSKRLLPMA